MPYVKKVSEEDRRELYTSVCDAFGPGPADTFMTLVDSIDPADIATKTDLSDLKEWMHQRFERIDDRFERIDDRFEKIDDRFERMSDRFVTAAIAFSSIMVAGFAAVIAGIIGLL